MDERLKKVILVRHGSAEDQVSEISDFERSLTTKGKITSKLMAEILKSKVNSPGLIVTSPAFRAYETAMIFGRVFGLDPDKTIVCKDLYFRPELATILNIFRSLGDKYDTVMLFGHNPLISETAQFLASGKTEELPKTGVISLTFHAEKWKSVEPAGGTVDFFLKPKSLL